MGTDQRSQPLLAPSNKIDMVDDDDQLTKIITTEKPCRATCTNCGFNGMTLVSKQRTTCGKILMILLLICCLCCIPMCIKGLN